MLRMDMRHARPGMILALPVRHPKSPSRCLLKVNFELTDMAINRLRDMAVRFVWVQYPALTSLDGFINKDVIESQTQLVSHVGECFEQMQKQATAKMAFKDYTESIGKMVGDLVANPQAAIFLGDLVDGHEDDMLRHSSTVSYLSVLMGLKLEGYVVKQRKHIPPGKAKEVTNLGIGGMLHDAGMLELEPEVRNAYLKTGDMSDPKFREHPSIGFRNLRGKIEPSAATIVLHHHQRFDGSGFAGKDWPVLDGERIHIFARICALADTFDRLRYPHHESSRSAVAVMRHLISASMFKQFDPRVMRALFTVVPPYPPGSILKLSDGRTATAIDHNPADPCRPQIQIIRDPGKAAPAAASDGDDEVINLAVCGPNLHVVQCDGEDVSEFNFESPAFMRDEMLALNTW